MIHLSITMIFTFIAIHYMIAFVCLNIFVKSSAFILKNGRAQDFNKISIHKKIPVPKSLFNKAAGAQLTLLWKNKTPIQGFFYEVQKIPLFSYESRKIYKNIAGWLLLNVIYLNYFERDSNTVVFLWILRDL